jgi:Kef-type K+ transport system membrane component KefB
MAVELSTMLLYLAIALIAAKLGGLIAMKFKEPGVLGELVAGIMIGPFVVGWISQQLFGAALFVDLGSPAGEILNVFADIGIILLLFLAGLSVDLEEFKRSEKPAALVATTGIIAAFLLGFGVAMAFGWTSVDAAFLGAVLAATSVGVTVRTLMDVHKLHTRVGMTILGAAIIDDIIAIVILGVLAGLALGIFTFVGLAENLVLMGIFFLGLVCIGKVLPRALMFVSRMHIEEATLAGALALVFLIGAVAEMVGVAALTGAFVVGLLASRAPAATLLKRKISTIGYGLFIPLFFVVIGAHTNLAVLMDAGFLVLILVGVAMFDKVIGCGIGALASGFSLRDSMRVGVGMMPRAEIALVIAAIGVKTGVVTPVLLSITVMIVLVTTLVTPVLVNLAFKKAPSGG